MGNSLQEKEYDERRYLPVRCDAAVEYPDDIWVAKLRENESLDNRKEGERERGNKLMHQ
jgi:hypothetical protein